MLLRCLMNDASSCISGAITSTFPDLPGPIFRKVLTHPLSYVMLYV